jgi:hypothetical protein
MQIWHGMIYLTTNLRRLRLWSTWYILQPSDNKFFLCSVRTTKHSVSRNVFLTMNKASVNINDRDKLKSMVWSNFSPESTAFISLRTASCDISGLMKNWANLCNRTSLINVKKHATLQEITVLFNKCALTEQNNTKRVYLSKASSKLSTLTSK